MSKRLIVAFVAVCAAGLVVFFATRPGDPMAGVKVVENRTPESLILVCKSCGQEFAAGEAKPMTGRQGLFVCPKCGQAVPIVAAKKSR